MRWLAALRQGLYAWQVIDHYRILQVQPTAPAEVIEKAYKALCLKYHPDRQPAERRGAATRRMQQLNEAYAVLSDPARRQEYDSVRARGDARQARESAMLKVFLDDGLIGLFRTWIKEGMG